LKKADPIRLFLVLADVGVRRRMARCIHPLSTGGNERPDTQGRPPSAAHRSLFTSEVPREDGRGLVTRRASALAKFTKLGAARAKAKI
jgi:hypothetical protein